MELHYLLTTGHVLFIPAAAAVASNFIKTTLKMKEHIYNTKNIWMLSVGTSQLRSCYSESGSLCFICVLSSSRTSPWTVGLNFYIPSPDVAGTRRSTFQDFVLFLLWYTYKLSEQIPPCALLFQRSGCSCSHRVLLATRSVITLRPLAHISPSLCWLL